MQAEAVTSAWPPGERLVDVAWYKAGALAALAAPAAAAADPPRSSPGWRAGGDCGEAARLCLLLWAGAPMRHLEQRPGMPPAIQEVCKPCLAFVKKVPPARDAAVGPEAMLPSCGRPCHLRSRLTRLTLLTRLPI